MNEIENAVQPVTDKTIHHAVNFHPEDYTILDYLDNQPPRWYPPMFCVGMPYDQFQQVMEDHRKAHAEAMERWRAEMDSFFPHRRQEQPSIRHCTHCGNGMVRYIVAVRHNPTGQNVVFGSECVARLGFANQNAFKLAQIKSRAEAGHARMKVFAAREKFLADNPAFAAVINNTEELANPVHAKNDFVRDIISKLNQYGSLSEKQVAAVVSSLQRDHEYAARKAAEAAKPKGPVPVGKRVEFAGVIVSSKWQENDFGGCTKILVELDNGARVWMTAPAALGDVVKGSKHTFRATVEASKDDPSFGFGKRPHLVASETPAAPAGPRNNVGEGS